MKRILLLIFVLSSCFVVEAQVKMGYLKYNEVLRQMPEYAQAQKSLTELKAKYEKEATRSEEEFQRKFSDFLQGQKDFPENIMVKRQAELQTLMEAGIKFRREAQQLLSKAEQDMLEGVRAKLNEAISTVAQQSGYLCVLNIDDNSCPFISPELGVDVTLPVLKILGLVEETTPVEGTGEVQP